MKSILLGSLLYFVSFLPQTIAQKTSVSITGNQFKINKQLTYRGREWHGHKIEGLLFNSRMVQGIFDDLNPATRDQFQYADTKKWDPERNTREFIAAMPLWKSHGMLAFTLNLQGGSPLGYGNKGWINSAFDPQGNLRPDYLRRLEMILNRANELGMVVILGYFYFGQDEHLQDEAAVIRAVDNISSWLLKKKYRNILVEINNECNISYNHPILQPERVHELIERVQNTRKGNYRLLVSTSYGGGTLPQPNVLKVADFVLLHGNGVRDPAKITKLVTDTKNVVGYHNTPILFNEDDHFNFEAEQNNFVAAIQAYASWGYFDYRMKDEGFEDGYQSVPVDWGINSERKKGFFKLLREVTGFKE
ncbi:MAG: hypothetical protein SFV55_15050 [Haliscomenobacter sp.]|uniref:hypothetical protein n=1 Tax=Haliscomenobacter sp. TaxID=2717303 RepID=UPI0029ACE82E|nr:hypothetical protein [Haliscomenobacter sp.]MDX2069744.1 hypothetical protein [Haliscomenobacter sp.]